MKTRIAMGICLFVIISSAHAVNFVDTTTMKDHAVDVDSIRRGDDSLVYFTEKTAMGLYDMAVDCQKRISYNTGRPDWKSHGSKVTPGSYGATVANFVCSRAR